MSDLQVNSVGTARPRTDPGTNSSRSTSKHRSPTGGAMLRFGGAVVNAPETQTIPRWNGLDDVPAWFGPCVVTVGVFDGMHRGHRQLVERAVRVGDARGLPTVLVTFDPHPARVLGLARDTAQLSTVSRRAELAAALGVDALCVAPFTSDFAQLRPAEFVQQVLVTGLGARAVVVGANFTFGHRAAGTVDTMRELGLQHGFTTHGVDLLHEAETRCSSSAVRECLRRGDIRGANRVLGCPHRIDGTVRLVETGVGELVTPPGTALPAAGRYRGRFLGSGPTTLTITDRGQMLVERVHAHTGAAGIELLAREEP